MNTFISPNLLFNDFYSIFSNLDLKQNSIEHKNFLRDKNLILDVNEEENFYIISGFFENFNDYNINLNYINDFLTIDFLNKNLFQNNTIDILDNYGIFRRMLYLENIDTNNIKLDFNNSIFQLFIKKLL